MCCVNLVMNCVSHEVSRSNVSEVSKRWYLSIIAHLAPSDRFWEHLENPTDAFSCLLKQGDQRVLGVLPNMWYFLSPILHFLKLFLSLKNIWEYEQAKDMFMETILAASSQDVRTS